MVDAKRRQASLIAFAVAFLAITGCSTTPPAPYKSAAPKPAPGSIGEALLRYRTLISEARAKHPYADSEQRMYDVMICESGGRALIVNPASPYTGLFQYSAATWAGAWNIYRDQPMTDARSQIFATALAWQKKMQSQWGCYKKTR